MFLAFFSFLSSCAYMQELAEDLTGNSENSSTNRSPDTTAPVVFSISPKSDVTNVSPVSGKIIVIFDEDMDTSLTPALTIEIHDTSGYLFMPGDGTVFAWTNARTLNIDLSWKQFPENTQIRWTLSKDNLRDIAGNVLAENIQHSFTTASTNTYFEIADTGQVDCYDNSVVLASCGNGSWPGQDADFSGIPGARNFSGPNLSYSDNYTTSDIVTGLIWKTCSEGQSGSDCTGGSVTLMNWYDAFTACSNLNDANAGAGYAGFSNWRMPTVNELNNLVDHGAGTPAIDESFFPTSSGTINWTATTYAMNSDNAWSVNFSNGTSGNALPKSSSSSVSVRCVSGNSRARPEFTDNGDATVTDNATRLIWQKCSAGQIYNGSTCTGSSDYIAWQTALNTCYALGGTWRLPSVNELLSIIDYSKSINPAVDENIFPGMEESQPYWSSTTDASSNNYSKNIYMSNGSISIYPKSSTTYFICVSGP